MLNSYLSITYVFPRHRPKQPPSRGSTAPKSVMGIQREYEMSYSKQLLTSSFYHHLLSHVHPRCPEDPVPSNVYCYTAQCAQVVVNKLVVVPNNFEFMHPISTQKRTSLTSQYYSRVLFLKISPLYTPTS